MEPSQPAGMPYRLLGDSGIEVSAIALGTWATFGHGLDASKAADVLQAAFDGGVNFIDTAEIYAQGASELVLGGALRRTGRHRSEFVVSSKFFAPTQPASAATRSCGRAHLHAAIPRSLDRLGLDHLDIAFCHRYDPLTPIEETVSAMSDAIDQGWARYWGTSEWPTFAIRKAHALATRHGLHKPITEQVEYNLLARDRVERTYAPLCDDYGMGLTTWSPLSCGVLAGRYLDGVPPGSRASRSEFGWLAAELTDTSRHNGLRAVATVADGIGATLAQLAIAWCASNPCVSSVIMGASSPEQVSENLGAVALIGRLDQNAMAAVDAALSGPS